MKKLTLIFVVLFSFILTNCTQKESVGNLIVIVKYKAQPEQSDSAIAELKKLIEQVQKEEHFVKLTIHVDPKNNSNILLYEEWDDENYFNNEHMKTKHLQEFMSKSRNFLTGPPEISFWKVEKIYK